MGWVWQLIFKRGTVSPSVTQLSPPLRTDHCPGFHRYLYSLSGAQAPREYSPQRNDEVEKSGVLDGYDRVRVVHKRRGSPDIISVIKVNESEDG